MTDKIGPNEMIHLHEQMEATMSNFAPIVASYYEALIKQDVPHELARDLTIDWHSIYWNYIIEQSNNVKK